MIKDLPEASTQYNDMQGTSAADWHPDSDIFEFAKSKGIDTNRYFPISLLIHGIDINYFSIYAVDTEITKKSFDEIWKYSEANNGTLPVVKFNFSSNINELKKYMKRFSVVLKSKMSSLEYFDELSEVNLD